MWRTRGWMMRGFNELVREKGDLQGRLGVFFYLFIHLVSVYLVTFGRGSLTGWPMVLVGRFGRSKNSRSDLKLLLFLA